MKLKLHFSTGPIRSDVMPYGQGLLDVEGIYVATEKDISSKILGA